MMDLNRDTKIDVWRFFDENGAVIKEELDLDFDGKIDASDYYLNGIVRRREIDFQFDEKTDVWKHFDEKGMLILIESDTTGNGKIDYWEYYNKAVIERIEKDTDGDGKPDIFKRSGDADFTKIMSTSEKFESTSTPEIEEKPEDEITEDAADQTNEADKPENE
jgi:antitoxin component YwqK of YwqJK toxin-antitoxin module